MKKLVILLVVLVSTLVLGLTVSAKDFESDSPEKAESISLTNGFEDADGHPINGPVKLP